MSSRDPAAALLTQAASTHGGCFVGKSMSRPELALAVEIEQVRGENIRLKTASSIVQGALTQVSAACEAERDGFKLALEREREALRKERVVLYVTDRPVWLVRRRNVSVMWLCCSGSRVR